MVEKTTFVARTALGAPIATFAERSLAIAWIEAEGDRFPGWTVSVETERTVTVTRTIRRDRTRFGVVAA